MFDAGSEFWTTGNWWSQYEFTPKPWLFEPQNRLNQSS
jgi:hypothetical protein